ncbi:MAG: hypothetical protein AVDCRST_MAG76-825 [uncultured Acidimicrobiales bacterium]|uniref:Nucleotidyltransferase family protein n=1 Tax=uncultured Acidimicrobiales bacterium TaxID=310071 RepID=A0A6J4HFM0_9ACTN|nr:MAG: hypothetical protein AVDCRST_MAG76-825 [uncultured Acidimicrobiales bacterium]
MPTEQSEEMLDSLKRVVAVLRDAGVPCALGGGLALWAFGSSPTDHDIDLLLPDGEAANRALEALEAAGMRTEVPPEGWLLKVWDGDVLVDLVFGPTGIDAAEAVAAAPSRNVHAMPMLVMRPEDVFVSKLAASTEHSLRFEPLLEHARALREQVDWHEVAKRTRDSPYARAFLTLLDGLGVVPAAELDTAR